MNNTCQDCGKTAGGLFSYTTIRTYMMGEKMPLCIDCAINRFATCSSCGVQFNDFIHLGQTLMPKNPTTSTNRYLLPNGYRICSSRHRPIETPDKTISGDYRPCSKLTLMTPLFLT